MRNSRFLTSISTLTSGSVIGQLVVLLTAPVLTRLYTPAELGSYTYLISFATIFMGVINGKYDMAVVVEDEEIKVFALIKLSLMIGVIFTFFGTLIFVIYNLVTANSMNSADVLFIVLVLFSYALIDVLTAYNNRQREYKVMAAVNVIRSVCQNIGAILLGFVHLGKTGLIIPYVIGQYLGANKQAKTLKRHWHEIKDVSGAELKNVLIKHKRQPLFSAPAALANSFSYSSITIFLNTLFGEALVGFYSISVRLLGLPLALISGNVSKVFFESAAKERAETGQFYSAFRKVLFFQLMLAMPIVIVMYFLGPPICEFVFGKEWRVAGDYIQILAPMFGIRFIVTTLTPAMIIAQKQKYELFIQLMFVVFSVICFFACSYLKLPVETYLIIISVLFSIVYLVYLVIIYYYSKGKNS